MHHVVYVKDFSVKEELLGKHLFRQVYRFRHPQRRSERQWQLEVLSAIASVKNADIKVIIIFTYAPYDLLNARLGCPFIRLETFEFR